MAHIRSANGKFHVQHNARIVGTFDSKEQAKDFIKNRKNPNIYQERVEEAKAKAEKEAAEKVAKAKAEKAAKAKAARAAKAAAKKAATKKK